MPEIKPQSENDDNRDELVRLLTEHQGQLRAYIHTLLGRYDDSLEILQRTNITLWKTSDRFRFDAPFLPWAFGIARYEVLNFLKEQNRNRVVFQTDVVELLAKASEEKDRGGDTWHERQDALQECLAALPAERFDIFKRRYLDGQSISVTAEETQRSIESVKSLMLRVRRVLRECIEKRIKRVC